MTTVQKSATFGIRNWDPYASVQNSLRRRSERPREFQAQLLPSLTKEPVRREHPRAISRRNSNGDVNWLLSGGRLLSFPSTPAVACVGLVDFDSTTRNRREEGWLRSPGRPSGIRFGRLISSQQSQRSAHLARSHDIRRQGRFLRRSRPGGGREVLRVGPRSRWWSRRSPGRP